MSFDGDYHGKTDQVVDAGLKVVLAMFLLGFTAMAVRVWIGWAGYGWIFEL